MGHYKQIEPPRARAFTWLWFRSDINDWEPVSYALVLTGRWSEGDQPGTMGTVYEADGLWVAKVLPLGSHEFVEVGTFRKVTSARNKVQAYWKKGHQYGGSGLIKMESKTARLVDYEYVWGREKWVK
jgi:hypothetical protein